MRRLAAGTAIAAALMAACGGGGESLSEPAQALEGHIQLLADGQLGRAWEQLYPAQQAFITKELYASCAPNDIPDIKLVRVKDEYPETITIPGTDQSVDAIALTVVLESGGETETDTFHEIKVDGGWRWVVSDPSIYTGC